MLICRCLADVFDAHVDARFAENFRRKLFAGNLQKMRADDDCAANRCGRRGADVFLGTLSGAVSGVGVRANTGL